MKDNALDKLIEFEKSVRKAYAGIVNEAKPFHKLSEDDKQKLYTLFERWGKEGANLLQEAEKYMRSLK